MGSYWKRIATTGFLMILMVALNGQEADTSVVNPGSENRGLEFLRQFDVDTLSAMKGKMLGDAVILIGPEPSAPSTNTRLSKGELVDIYKYLPREQCWVVKYGSVWGFVPTQYIMPVQEPMEPGNYQPYDEPPVPLGRMKIKYPREAVDKGISGQVVVKVLISSGGEILETEIVRGIRELNDAAVDAVKNLKFKPGKYRGNPVEVWTRIPVNFNLE